MIGGDTFIGVGRYYENYAGTTGVKVRGHRIKHPSTTDSSGETDTNALYSYIEVARLARLIQAYDANYKPILERILKCTKKRTIQLSVLFNFMIFFSSQIKNRTWQYIILGRLKLL